MQQVRASGYYLIYKRYKRANFRLHRPLYNHGDNHPCSGFGGGGGGNERVRKIQKDTRIALYRDASLRGKHGKQLRPLFTPVH